MSEGEPVGRVEMQVSRTIASKDALAAGNRPGGRAAGTRPWAAGEEKAITSRRCVLCGRTYQACDCKCTWCGEKKWRLDGYWKHHVCARTK